MTDWQSIETAPHYPAIILLSNGVWVRVGWLDRDGEYAELIATVHDEYGRGYEYWLDIGKGQEPYAEHYTDFIRPDRPSHWMPLPAPPEGSRQ